MGYYFIKRLFDVLLSLFGLIILTPVFVIVSIMLLFTIGSPIFFIQNRPGLQSNPFFMYKFRTMTDEYDESGELLSDDARLTKFGKFLRSTSLDELPALWNVLKGDMSLVGPRPLLMEYLDRYTPEQARRHDVKPGITGWAQVNGRNTISWKEKFEYDIWYVENLSFWLDLKIFFMTIIKIIKLDGINSETSVTMERFKGN